MPRPAPWNQTPERRECARQLGLARRTHGASQRGDLLYSTYNSWRAMKERCDNPKGRFYARYGGRGIAYDPAWAAFEGFLADMGPRPDGTTLDRIDNDGPYGPGNCRWASALDQASTRQRGRGYRRRTFHPPNFGTKTIACFDGCGRTEIVRSTVHRWRCPEHRAAAARRAVDRYRAKHLSPCYFRANPAWKVIEPTPVRVHVALT